MLLYHLLWIMAILLRAGEAVGSINGASFLPVPPVGILLDQQLVDTSTKTSDGVSKKTSYLTQSIFATACSATGDDLVLYPLDVHVRLDSPTAGTCD